MLTNNRLALLIIKYRHETLTESEINELRELLASSAEKRILFHRLTDWNYLLKELREMYQFDNKRCWKKVMQINAK